MALCYGGSREPGAGRTSAQRREWRAIELTVEGYGAQALGSSFREPRGVASGQIRRPLARLPKNERCRTWRGGLHPESDVDPRDWTSRSIAARGSVRPVAPDRSADRTSGGAGARADQLSHLSLLRAG